MSTLAQELKSKLATLSREDRLELTFFLLDQLHADDDPQWLAAWTEELHRRENDPRFRARIVQARESVRAGKGVKLESLESAAYPRTKHRARR